MRKKQKEDRRKMYLYVLFFVFQEFICFSCKLYNGKVTPKIRYAKWGIDNNIALHF